MFFSDNSTASKFKILVVLSQPSTEALKISYRPKNSTVKSERGIANNQKKKKTIYNILICHLEHLFHFGVIGTLYTHLQSPHWSDEALCPCNNSEKDVTYFASARTVDAK